MNTILHAVLEATIVSKFVMALLLVMSLASWAYMAGKWATLRSARRRVVAGAARFEEAGVLDAALPVLEGDSISPLFRITGRAVKEFNRINATGDADRLIDNNVRRALHQGIDEEMSRLKSSLALLATAANTAPFIGLFGTVWGIMNAFTGLSTLDNVSLAVVAPGIAEALVATAIGLFAAIPAVAAYNYYNNRVGRLTVRLEGFSEEFLNILQRQHARS